MAMLGADEILVKQLLCLNQRICSHNCAKCQEICPQNAIEINKETGIVTLNSHCTNCGLCLSECPAQAIVWKHFMRYPLKIRDEKAEVFCTKLKCDGYASCLVNLSEYELAYLAMKAELHLCVDKAVCMKCNPNIIGHIDRQIKRVNSFLAKVKLKPIEFSWQQDQAVGEMNRRELFQFFFTKLKQSIGEVLPIANQLSDYRILLVEELQRNFAESTGDAAPFFQGAKGLQACTMCGACVRACRNKALQIVIDGATNSYALRHDQTLCTGCNVCSIICPEKAIEISADHSSLESIGKNKPTLVIKKALILCEICGATIIEGVHKVCPDCRRKQDKKLQDIY
jgi:MinD superfamily P-loop ATPase